MVTLAEQINTMSDSITTLSQQIVAIQNSIGVFDALDTVTVLTKIKNLDAKIDTSTGSIKMKSDRLLISATNEITLSKTPLLDSSFIVKLYKISDTDVNVLELCGEIDTPDYTVAGNVLTLNSDYNTYANNPSFVVNVIYLAG